MWLSLRTSSISIRSGAPREQQLKLTDLVSLVSGFHLGDPEELLHDGLFRQILGIVLGQRCQRVQGDRLEFRHADLSAPYLWGLLLGINHHLHDVS